MEHNIIPQVGRNMASIRTLYSKKEGPPRPVVNIAAARKLAESWMSSVDTFFPREYDIPLNPDMAIIIVFFNPSFSVRNIQNILMTKHFIESAGIPLYIGELAFD